MPKAQGASLLRLSWWVPCLGMPQLSLQQATQPGFLPPGFRSEMLLSLACRWVCWEETRSSAPAFAFPRPKLRFLWSPVPCLSCTLTQPLLLLDVMWEKWLTSVSYLTDLRTFYPYTCFEKEALLSLDPVCCLQPVFLRLLY